MVAYRRKWLVWFTAVCLLVATACSGNGSSGAEGGEGEAGSGKEPVRLKFMYWGSAFEKQAMENMVEAFNKSHPDIVVQAEHVPGDYAAKINTLMATNELPDIAYLSEPLSMKWGAEGRLLDMKPYMELYPQLAERLEQTYYNPAPDKTLGTNTAVEMITLYYNKDLFEEAGVAPPPTKGENAWTWDEFVETAKKLTKDNNGNTPFDPGFNPNSIVQYGVSFPTWIGGWYPFLLSNGGDITNDDGTQYTLDSPEAIEVFQKLQDLMYVHHVAPTATQQQNMPATNVRLQTKKVAMAIDGQWALLDFASTKMNFGMGVLPKFKEPKTIVLGSPTVIFANTAHPDEAIRFYLYHNDPKQVDLYAKGLWMPLEEKYYTDPAEIAYWTDNEAHPPEYKDAVIDFTLNYAGRSPMYFLKNMAEIEPVINAALDKLWTNKEPAEKVLRDLKQEVQPLLQGKYQ